MDHRQGHKQVHRTAAGKVNFKRAFYSILPQLEFDRSDQGGAEPKKSCKKLKTPFVRVGSLLAPQHLERL